MDVRIEDAGPLLVWVKQQERALLGKSEECFHFGGWTASCDTKVTFESRFVFNSPGKTSIFNYFGS